MLSIDAFGCGHGVVSKLLAARCPHLYLKPAGKESAMAKASPPVAKFRLGYVTASVWKNEDFHNVTVSKSYKDGDEWKDTDSLGAGDIMNAVRVLQRAEDFIAAQ
jgi:hypothetical protein